MKKNKWTILLLALILFATYEALVTVLSQSTASFGLISTTATQIALVTLAAIAVYLAWKKGGKYRTLLTLLVALSLFASILIIMQNGTVLPERLVGAYFYVWYGDVGKEWQNRDVYPLPDEPLLGRYSSSDPAVITQHLTWAKSYGIDFFAVSLWKSDFMLNNTKLMFEMNKKMGNPIKLCVMIEPAKTEEVSELADEAWSLTGYESYLHWYGKPLLFVYTVYVGQLAQWSDSRFTVKFVPTEVPYFTENLQTTFVGDAVSVKAGANVSYAQVDRQNGQYYTKQWEFAVAWGRLNAQRNLMVIITSFNEWMEDTAIEASPSWGLQYLQITKEYSDAFRKVL